MFHTLFVCEVIKGSRLPQVSARLGQSSMMGLVYHLFQKSCIYQRDTFTKRKNVSVKAVKVINKSEDLFVETVCIYFVPEAQLLNRFLIVLLWQQ